MERASADDNHGERSRRVALDDLARDGAEKPLERSHQRTMPRGSCVCCRHLAMVGALQIGQIAFQTSRLPRGAEPVFNTGRNSLRQRARLNQPAHSFVQRCKGERGRDTLAFCREHVARQAQRTERHAFVSTGDAGERHAWAALPASDLLAQTRMGAARGERNVAIQKLVSGLDHGLGKRLGEQDG